MFILDLLHLLWPLVLSLAIWLVIHYAFSKLPPVNHIPFSLEENEDTSVPSPLIHTSATTSQPKTSSENQSRITSLSRRFSAPTWELKRDQEDNYDHENKENETYSPPRGFFVQQLRKSKRINLPPGVPLAQPKWPRLANKGVANTVMDTQTDYIMKPISSLAEEKLGFRKMRAETAEDSGNASLRDSFSAPRSDAEEEEEMEKVEESPAEKCDYTCACDSILPSDVLLASKLTLVENDREVMELTTSIEEHSKDVKGDVQLVDNLCQIEDIESATEKNADKLLRRLTTGRNLLNKKEVAPSTIKESSESSQTIDEQDGGSAAAAAADKAALKHENVARVDTVVRVDTVGNKTTAGFQQQVTNCLTGAATGSAAPSPAPPTAGVSPRPSAHHSSASFFQV
uniref:Uncharacterized protein n=1 Tax=Ditylenchus dipsaci TaxID=166011 RepID=A0A915DCG5_9BILA